MLEATGEIGSNRRLEMTNTRLQTSPPELSDVAETALVTLFCRALESASGNPLIHDPVAEDRGGDGLHIFNAHHVGAH